MRQQFTATASQTTFTVSGGYLVNLVDVYLNGVKLVNGTDVTVSSGTSVVLASGAAAGDIIEVVGLSAFSIANYLPLAGGTLSGTLNIGSGTLQIAGKKAVNGPAVSVYVNTSQTLTSGSLTKVQLNAEDFDTDNAFDSTTNYRFTPLVEGYYQVAGRMTVTAGTTATSLTLYAYKNGVAVKAGPTFIAPSGTGMSTDLTCLVYMNGSTDYLEYYVNAQGTGTLTISTGSVTSFFSAAMVRGA